MRSKHAIPKLRGEALLVLQCTVVSWHVMSDVKRNVWQANQHLRSGVICNFSKVTEPVKSGREAGMSST